jgi:hypothetical protein
VLGRERREDRREEREKREERGEKREEKKKRQEKSEQRGEEKRRGGYTKTTITPTFVTSIQSIVLSPSSPRMAVKPAPIEPLGYGVHAFSPALIFVLF